MKKLPEDLYKEILKNMPIICADGLLHYGKKFILFKRAYEPAKDQWWIFGGRLEKGESLEECVRRKAKEEIGIDIKIEKQVGVYETIFNKNRFGSSTHTVSVAFLVTADKKPDFSKIEYDEFTDVKEFDEIDEKWHWYVKQLIKDSGILND